MGWSSGIAQRIPSTFVSSYATIAAAIAACPTDGTLVLPAGDISVASTITFNKRMRIVGGGPELGTRFVATSALGTDPAIVLAPGAGLHHMSLRDFAVDLSAAPGAIGIKASDFDNLDMDHLKVRGGAIAYDLFDMSIVRATRCDAYNPQRSGWRLDTTSHDVKGVGMWFNDCEVYWTSSQTPAIAAFAGWEVLDARDIHWNGSYAIQTDDTTTTLQWGYYVSLDSASFGGFFFNGGAESDGIEDDSTAGASGTCAAMYLKNAAKVFASGMWLSAAPSGDNYHPAVWIDGGSEFYFDSTCRFSGDPAVVLRGAPSHLDFSGVIPATCTTVIFDIDDASPPTFLTHRLKNLSSAPLSNHLTEFATATARLVESAPKMNTGLGSGTQGFQLWNPDNDKVVLVRIESGATGNLAFCTVGGTVLARVLQAGGLTVGATSCALRAGSGTPEGAISAVVGSVYLRSDGGANTSFYVKESGAGNTGWVAK